MTTQTSRRKFIQAGMLSRLKQKVLRLLFLKKWIVLLETQSVH